MIQKTLRFIKRNPSVMKGLRAGAAASHKHPPIKRRRRKKAEKRTRWLKQLKRTLARMAAVADGRNNAVSRKVLAEMEADARALMKRLGVRGKDCDMVISGEVELDPSLTRVRRPSRTRTGARRFPAEKPSVRPAAPVLKVANTVSPSLAGLAAGSSGTPAPAPNDPIAGVAPGAEGVESAEELESIHPAYVLPELVKPKHPRPHGLGEIQGKYLLAGKKGRVARGSCDVCWEASVPLRVYPGEYLSVVRLCRECEALMLRWSFGEMGWKADAG